MADDTVLDERLRDMMRAKVTAGGKTPEQEEEFYQEQEGKRKKAREPVERALQTEQQFLESLLAAPPAGPPPVPKLQNLPERPQPQRQDPMLAFQQPAVLLAMLASGLSRRPLTAALNAAAGAMEGFKGADDQRVKDEVDAWKQNMDRVKEQNDVETKRVNAILSARNLTAKEKLDRLHLHSVVTQNATAQAILQSGNLDEAEKHFNAVQQAAERTVSAGVKLTEFFAAEERKKEEAIAKRADAEERREQMKEQFLERQNLQRERMEKQAEERKAKAKDAALGNYKSTEAQNKAMQYAAMLEGGIANMDDVLKEGYRPSAVDMKLFLKMADSARNQPHGFWDSLTGGIAEVAGSYGLSDQAQRFYQAAREITAGVLRPETGAAFGSGELRDTIQRYIPVPGETKATFEQKTRARDQKRDVTWMATGLPQNAWNLESAKRVMGGGVPAAGKPVTVRTKEERDALAPGTEYQRPGDPAVYTKE